ncbi:hypothetical protein T03_3509 [Trichinella britovi]|uniref:Uncharacterized protein n=1 Tax=Trichinella britovi TaxID=45882 RepID=A0A0V1C602_TRIBR|nr:hypothetical protein T03_3509 [Trichinella britovi]
MIYSIRYSRFLGLPATRQKLLFTEEQTRIKHAQKFSMYHSLSREVAFQLDLRKVVSDFETALIPPI